MDRADGSKGGIKNFLCAVVLWTIYKNEYHHKMTNSNGAYALTYGKHMRWYSPTAWAITLFALFAMYIWSEGIKNFTKDTHVAYSKSPVATNIRKGVFTPKPSTRKIQYYLFIITYGT